MERDSEDSDSNNRFHDAEDAAEGHDAAPAILGNWYDEEEDEHDPDYADEDEDEEFHGKP